MDRFVADQRIHEVHPEVSFSVLARTLGEPTSLPPKAKWAGLVRRRALLGRAGIVIPEDELGPTGARAGPDDLIDAAVAAWSAQRIASDDAVSHPATPTEFDSSRTISIRA